MVSRDRGYRIANGLAAVVGSIVGLIMIVAALQAIVEVPDEKQSLWILLFLSVAVTFTSFGFLITEICRRPKKEPARPGDSEA